MQVSDLIAPIPLDEFKARYFGRRPLAMTRAGNPFQDLVTLRELQDKLNDGLASDLRVQVVSERLGRVPQKLLYREGHRQTGNGALLKAKLRDYLEAGHSIICYNLSDMNDGVAALARSFEEEFAGHHCDLHVYLSPSRDASTLKTHADRPQQKFYLQLIGNTHWTVFRRKRPDSLAGAQVIPEAEIDRHLDVEFDVVLTPGSFLYMPPDTFHRVKLMGTPRVSLSFLVTHAPETPQVDRARIDLGALFRRETSTSCDLVVGDAA
jgi:ribosomal protein L16 Arg81 hydroxylase